MSKYIKPNWQKSALITIDTQNDFSLPNSPGEIKGTIDVIPNMVQLLNLYRKKVLPIIHVIRLYEKDGSNVDLCRKEAFELGKYVVTPGSYGCELVKEIMPPNATKLAYDKLIKGDFQKIGQHEWVMYKPRWGAFYKTSLESFLHNLKIDTLVFCGCNFPNCPRASIYEAGERDFKIVIAKDAISGIYDKGINDSIHMGINVLKTKEIIKMADNI